MNELHARFSQMPWVDIAVGAREKRLEFAGQTARLVQFSPPFQETDWCQKPHAGFIVDGQMKIQFPNEQLEFMTGDAFIIPASKHTAHQAIVEQTVTLFLVEESEP